jgi:hypothetical protein
MITTLLIGVALGACWACGVIFSLCVVTKKEDWKAEHDLKMAVCMRVFRLEAENARLRLGLAAGEMTGDGKKIATMAMAALDAISTAESQALLKQKPSPA